MSEEGLLTSFEGKTYYEILGVAKSASAADIRRAYKSKARRIHPDKHPGEKNAQATRDFQALGIVMEVMGDSCKRAAYDKHTFPFSSQHQPEMETLDVARWTTFYDRVTSTKIEGVAKVYRMSDEEKQDVIAAYVKYEGDMNLIIAHVLLSVDEDRSRFQSIIQSAIDSKHIPDFGFHNLNGTENDLEGHDLSSNDDDDDEDEDEDDEDKDDEKQPRYAKRVRRVSSSPSKNLPKKSGNFSGGAVALPNKDDWVQTIQQRQKQRFETMLTSIQNKYVKQQMEQEPTEEEFQAARAKVDAARQGVTQILGTKRKRKHQ